MTIQITRSGASIPASIAEGNRRSSEKHYRHFAEISLGYSYEPETPLLIAQKVDIGDQDLILKTLADVSEEKKMLVGCIYKPGRWRSAFLFYGNLLVACGEKLGAHTK